VSKIKFKDYREKLKEETLPVTSCSIRKVHPRKKSPDEEKRINFRIIKCCLNCRFHFSTGPNPVRMGCSFPYTPQSKATQLKWPKSKPISTKAFMLKLAPAHAACCCSHHEFKISGGMGLAHITRYCGAEYLGDDVW